jgi:hypothetical protein
VAVPAVLAATNADEIDAPGRRLGIEGQGLERDADLRYPAVVVLLRPGFPETIPVAFHLADVLKQAFPAHAVGIDLESITAAPIQIRIEDDGEHVVGVEGLPLPQDSIGDLSRVGFIHPRAHVERVFRVEDAHVSRLGRRAVFLGEYLMQVLDQRRLRPLRFVQHAVDGRSIRQLRDLHRLRDASCLTWRLGNSGARQQQQHCE